MIEVLDKYVKFLWERFMSDMDVLTNVWMYIPILIPFIFYMIFFIIKWYILLFPITLPISIMKGLFKIKIRNENGISTKSEILKEMSDDMEDIGVHPDRSYKVIMEWKKKFRVTRKN